MDEILSNIQEIKAVLECGHMQLLFANTMLQLISTNVYGVR
jgi:hypothetical protein